MWTWVEKAAEKIADAVIGEAHDVASEVETVARDAEHVAVKVADRAEGLGVIVETFVVGRLAWTMDELRAAFDASDDELRAEMTHLESQQKIAATGPDSWRQ